LHQVGDKKSYAKKYLALADEFFMSAYYGT